MQELFNLGSLYVSDFLSPQDQPRALPVEMKMMFDSKTALVKLDKMAQKNVMYGKYWYRSGINPAMKQELQGIVESVQRVVTLTPGDTWLDIACNDGTLLSNVPNYLVRVGVDPAEDSYLEESRLSADLVIQDYFNRDTLLTHGVTQQARVITCIAMFYDLEEPGIFLDDVCATLHDDGVFVCQLSYTPLMIEQMAFDNICHEHIYYYTMTTLTNLFASHGLQMLDVQLNDVNGGSFRVYAMKTQADVTKFATQPQRDVAQFRIKSLLAYEELNGYNTADVWSAFFNNLQQLKTKTVEFICEQRAVGKTVWGYGASTKGNTLLQYFGLDHTMIDGIAERSPYKYGLRTVGTNIPIYSENEMRSANPDFLLVLPWHFIHTFQEREQAYLQQGGKFIVPCPKFMVIGA